jgi:hypothetical protein
MLAAYPRTFVAYIPLSTPKWDAKEDSKPFVSPPIESVGRPHVDSTLVDPDEVFGRVSTGLKAELAPGLLVSLCSRFRQLWYI